MNPQTVFAAINQSRLYYEQAGTGYPLVLVHGFSLDGRMWDEQFAFSPSIFALFATICTVLGNHHNLINPIPT